MCALRKNEGHLIVFVVLLPPLPPERWQQSQQQQHLELQQREKWKQKQENKKIEQVTDANGRRDYSAGSMTGLSFHLSASFRLETYWDLFPLPIVVASARWGDVAAWRTLLVAFLVDITCGPLPPQIRVFVWFHRPSLGNVLKRKFSWVQSVPISALARTIGVFLLSRFPL